MFQEFNQMGHLSRIKSIFTREKCKKWIYYNAVDLTFESLSVDIPSMKFSLANFHTETRKIRDASEFSQLLDDYQYQMCRICNELGKEDEDWKKYMAIRAGVINLLALLQSTLIAFKSDPDGQKSSLYDLSGRLQDYVLLIHEKILPNIENLQSKSVIPKGDVPKLDARDVSVALKFSGLDEYEVYEFVDELKSESQ